MQISLVADDRVERSGFRRGVGSAEGGIGYSRYILHFIIV